MTQLESEERAIWGAKSEQIRQLAYNYEKLHDAGIYKEPISHICATIAEECSRRNLWASHALARKVLDDRYKQVEFTRDAFKVTSSDSSEIKEVALMSDAVPSSEATTEEQKFITTTGTVTPDQFSDYYSNANDFGQMFPTYQNPNADVQIDFLLQNKQSKSIDQMNPEELRDMTEKLIDAERKATDQQRELRRRKREAVERCNQLKIPLSPDYEQPQDEHIGTIYGETGISYAWKKLDEYIRILEKVQDKLYYFKPPAKIARKMGDALEEEIEFWRPMADEKFRKDSMSWWVTQLDNLWYGKHAAAQRNATILEDRTRRALTREQVGDKQEEVLQRALRFSTAMIWRVEFQLWYINQIEPKIGFRAKRLHRILSEKSFT